MGQAQAVSPRADIFSRTVPFRITNPERIPSKRYYDEAFYKLEVELFWPHVWQMACRLEEIPAVGDWVEYKILDKSVIVIRTNSGVRAFHNACRHRGVKLLSGHGNCKERGITCPFHGWHWNTEGQNTFVFAPHLFSKENLEAAELNLVPCRVELWGGCAFINFDSSAPPLLECLKPVANRMDPRMVDKLRVEWWHSAVLPVNWKLAMEAFMEGYHVMRTHPQLQQVNLPGYDSYSRPREGDVLSEMAREMSTHTADELVDMFIHYNAVLSEGMAGMVHANDVAIARDLKKKVKLPSEPFAGIMEWNRLLNDEITQRNRARGVSFPDLNELAVKHQAAPVQFIFPHYFLLPLFGNAASYRIRPLGPESCLFEIWSLVLYPEGETRPRPVEPTPRAHDDKRFPLIPQQDYSNLPRQQLGLHASGFEYMRLSRNVEGMISNYQRTLDGFLGGVSKDRLVKAMQVASGELDDSIKDIGF